MTRRQARARALGLAAILAGCRPGAVQDCLDLTEAQQYEKAAPRCEEAYAAAGDPAAAVAAARAH
jgi:hypothetical protein